MHLETHVIQTAGFHNTSDDAGNITGFQFRIRTGYYKGLWLSQIRVGEVTVDGKVYPRQSQIWEIGGIEYTPDEMLEIGDQMEATYLQVNDTITVKLDEPGGLSQGYHTLSIKFGWVHGGRGLMSDLGVTYLENNNERSLIIV